MLRLYSASHCIQGRRQSMEDEHCNYDNFNSELGVDDGVTRGLYCIYDGHGGTVVAKLCKVYF